MILKIFLIVFALVWVFYVVYVLFVKNNKSKKEKKSENGADKVNSVIGSNVVLENKDLDFKVEFDNQNLSEKELIEAGHQVFDMMQFLEKSKSWKKEGSATVEEKINEKAKEVTPIELDTPDIDYNENDFEVGESSDEIDFDELEKLAENIPSSEELTGMSDEELDSLKDEESKEENGRNFELQEGDVTFDDLINNN